jgi:hypothetical protein
MEEKDWYPTNPTERKALGAEIDAATCIYPDVCSIITDYLYHPDTLQPATDPRQSKLFPAVPLSARRHVIDAVGKDVFKDTFCDIRLKTNGCDRPCPSARAMCTRCTVTAFAIEKRFIVCNDWWSGGTFTKKLPGNPLILVDSSAYLGGCRDFGVCFVDEGKKRVVCYQTAGYNYVVANALTCDDNLLRAFQTYGSLLPTCGKDLAERAQQFFERERELLGI